MKLSPVIASIAVAALALSLACGHEGGASPPSTPTATGASVSAEAHHEHGGDPTDALLRATRDLKLADAQTATVHSLEEQLEANERETAAAFKTLHSDLTAQVRAGAIDNAKLQGDESAAAAALQAHIAKEGDTLNALHTALDPSQRKAVVAAVRAKQAAHAQEHMHEGANAQPGEDLAQKRLAHLTEELGLDATQQPQVAALLKAQPRTEHEVMAEHTKRMDALLTAFEGDAFDAKALATSGSRAPAEEIRERFDREVGFLSKLVPIMRPDQREKLAASMEKHGGMGHAHGAED